MTSFAERLTAIQEKIATAAARSGRSADEVELVGVSKGHPPESLLEGLDAGLSLFGESRVQEARGKIPLLPGRARWHFIGHLQKNKVRHALPLFEMFHSVDSLGLARDFDRIAEEESQRPRVLLEVNLAGEASKFGFRPSQLRAELEEIIALSRLTVEGLMTIPPPTPDAEGSRRYFSDLRSLRDELQGEFQIGLPHLSMGMSGDFAVAVEEGATLVRVGTALFGARTGKTWRPAGEPE